MQNLYGIRSITPPKLQRSFAEQAYDILEEMIVTLVLPPGATLSESELIDKTGLGRTPMREALQRLSDVGLIDIIPRQGTRVTEIDVSDQLLLLEVRRELERLIATSAARRRTAEQGALLSEMAVAMRRAAATDDYLLFLRVDRAFNQCVAESSANRHLVKAITPIHEQPALRGINIIVHTTFRLPQSVTRKSWKQSLQQILLPPAQHRIDFSTMSYLSHHRPEAATSVPRTRLIPRRPPQRCGTNSRFAQ